MESKENAARSAPLPVKRPRGKRKALADLPITGPNTSDGSAPRASKPRTRSAARAEAEVEEARKRREAEDAARAPDVSRLLDPKRVKRPDACAAQAAVAPYLGDIDRYLRSLEVEPLIRPNADNFWKIQKDISPNMRAILVDWLVEVAGEFKLQAETLYLAVSYVDRFLTRDIITRDKLQLLGVAALLVAAKYEEVESSKMKVNKYSDITDGTYTKQQVVKMEADLLKSLNFEIGGPTIRTFLRLFITSFSGGNGASAKKLESMCSYLAELSLLDYDCIRYLPSIVAAACLFVARFTIHPKTRPWVSDLQDSIFAIHELQLSIRWPDQKAIREKYKDRKFGCVSTMASPREIPASFLEDHNK
ncbi:cyclin-A3-1-like isoform X2 [Phragmites australis]|uniref:cyclin-A3-1-like isoform X2 n=1 Tax=Phragmites australis TaxID=29695 RepID=UPI002D77CC49|nr:cyclin-A3-1-like isoform X2 [Phragmites australis]